MLAILFILIYASELKSCTYLHAHLLFYVNLIVLESIFAHFQLYSLYKTVKMVHTYESLYRNENERRFGDAITIIIVVCRYNGNIFVLKS